jgi:hypothetical protein
MTDPVLRLEMEGSREFVITMPGTSYKVTFRELADGPGLSRAGVDRVGGRDAWEILACRPHTGTYLGKSPSRCQIFGWERPRGLSSQQTSLQV